MLIADSFRPSAPSEVTPKSVAILGLAGGTAARQYTAAFGASVQITGVEIDPDIVDVAHRYFHLNEPNVHPVVADARYWLDTQAAKYDVIVMDAYRQPYIPFHLTTREFFSGVRDHLAPGGVAVVNAGRTASDYRLVDALAGQRLIRLEAKQPDASGRNHSVALIDHVRLPHLRLAAAGDGRGYRTQVRAGAHRADEARVVLQADDVLAALSREQVSAHG